MTDPLYAELAATSSQLLDEFGQSVTLRNVVIGAYDPATGTAATTSSDVTRKGALFDFGQGQVNGPGGLVQVGDKKLLLEVGTKPGLEDLVIIGTDQYAVKGVAEANPAGAPVLYTLHLRKG